MLELGENLQSCSFDGSEIHTVVTILADGVRAMVLNLLPLAIGIFVVKCPRLGGAEVSIVMALPRQSGETEEQPGGRRTLLVRDPHFLLYAYDLDGRLTLPTGKMQFLTATAKGCTLCWENQQEPLLPWQSAVLPAALPEIAVEGSGRIFISAAV